MPEIRFDNVSVDFDERHVLDGIDLTLTERRIGIIGANGSGKSTLARLINGLGEPTSGRVTVDGLDVSEKGREVRRRVGFIFSDADNQIIMPTVLDDVAFSLRRHGLSRGERNERARETLARFDLDGHADQSPHLLSGGQKQLLALSSVLVTDPETIVADEPTTLLDLRNRRRIRRVFAQLDQQLIVVTHDLELIEDADRVIYIGGGRVRADGAPREVIARYTEDMDRLDRAETAAAAAPAGDRTVSPDGDPGAAADPAGDQPRSPETGPGEAAGAAARPVSKQER